MTKKEHDELVKMAVKAATDAFNAQPFEIRKKLANGYDRLHEINLLFTGGWSNKLFVRAYLMPHQIQITGVRIEKLQAISEDDCLKEGVRMRTEQHPRQEFEPEYTFGEGKYHAQNPIAAFAALIEKPGVGRKGLWESNPFIVVYEFKLVK